jgi:hypothetical protein
LGGLPEREREQLEAEYFENDDAFEQMLIAEEELTDAYVRGELSTEERARFEARYLSSSQGRERVQFARALAGAVSAARSAETTVEPVVTEVAGTSGRSFFNSLRASAAAWRFAFAAAAVVVVVGLTWLLVERARMHDELRQLRGERAALVEKAQDLERRVTAEQARSNELLTQLEGDRPRPTPEAVPTPEQVRPPPEIVRESRRPFIAFSLTPGLVRSGGGRTLNVPPGESLIKLRLKIESDGPTYTSYRAVIETAEGREVWRADSITAPTAAGTLNLPAIHGKDLPPGDYVLLLSGKRPDGGFEGVADYSFKVVRK